MSTSPTVREFDLAGNSLEPGKMLIEASAGTGKTYSLTAIILRLVVEKQIPIEEILVVTFTEAATAELKSRIRSAINALIKALQASEKPKDPIALLYWKPVPDEQVNLAIDRLAGALNSIDKASVSTIHAFCASVLKENAFESGSLFGDEVITNERDLLEEVTSDFWRNLFYGEQEPSYFAFLNTIGLTSLSQLQRTYAQWKKTAPMEQLQSEEPGSFNIPDSYKQLRELSEAFQQAVIDEYKDLVAIVTGNQLSGNKYRQPRKEALMRLFDEIKQADDPLTVLLQFCDAKDRYKYITQENISAANCAKTTMNLERKAFRIGSKLQALDDEITATFADHLGAEIDRELTRRKERINVISFDDMLVKTHKALETNTLLGESLREQFQVALIDEFQDTDRIQLDIFKCIFDTPSHRLYCVGDPKQSIYKFRGADIDTYLDASRSDSGFRKFSLSKNYRSDEAIVEATNQLFTARKDGENTFGDEGIEFRPSAVPPEKTGKGISESAFILRCLGGSPSVMSTAKAVVNEIKRIRRDYSGYTFRSIAVLVNSHDQAQAVANICIENRIPHIRRVDHSVYNSEAAVTMHTALSGILECNRIGKLKAALSTPLFGRSFRELRELDHDDHALNSELDVMYAIRNQWQEQGFISAFSLISTGGNLRGRLLSQPGGEEYLNNVLHLAELLHDHEQRNHAAPETLVKFLAQKHEEEKEAGTETSRIRKATDADAVVISTIHASKGLEYDAVVVPFAWSQPSNDDRDENTRKLYVATTRAKETCTILVGGNKYTPKTALGRILGYTDPETDICALAESFAEKSSGWLQYAGPLGELADAPGGELISTDLVLPEPPSHIRPGLVMTSFSSLSAGIHHRPDSDVLVNDKAAVQQDDKEDIELDPAGKMASKPLLPAGAKTGRVLHGILEKIDFQNPANLEEEIVENLRKEGYDPDAYAGYLQDHVRKWLKTPLNLDGTIRLDEIPAGRRMSEMEFDFPLATFAMQSIAEAIRPEQWPELEEKVAHVHSLAGYMKGFIDMVFERDGKFHIVDWKSNYLEQGYDQDSIRESMLSSLYPLQYLIYTVALDAYLQERVVNYHYDTHFGGVYYVYLREFGKGPGHSVYFSKPKTETITNLRNILVNPSGRRKPI